MYLKEISIMHNFTHHSSSVHCFVSKCIFSVYRFIHHFYSLNACQWSCEYLMCAFDNQSFDFLFISLLIPICPSLLYPVLPCITLLSSSLFYHVLCCLILSCHILFYPYPIFFIEILTKCNTSTSSSFLFFASHRAISTLALTVNFNQSSMF
jgi:hypothetical protein